MRPITLVEIWAYISAGGVTYAVMHAWRHTVTGTPPSGLSVLLFLAAVWMVHGASLRGIHGASLSRSAIGATVAALAWMPFCAARATGIIDKPSFMGYSSLAIALASIAIALRCRIGLGSATANALVSGLMLACTWYLAVEQIGYYEH